MNDIEVGKSYSLPPITDPNILALISDMQANHPSIQEVDVEKITIGDVIKISGGQGYGGHYAHIVVKKLNRKSFVGVEQEGSYRAGRAWRVYKNAAFALRVVRDDGRHIYKWIND